MGIENQAEPERIARFLATVKRAADGLLSAPDLTWLFQKAIELDADPRREKSLGWTVISWELIGNGLEPELPDHEAVEAEYAEAIDQLYTAEARRARLAALPRGWTCGELLSADFPPPVWIVPELLVPGLTILAGAPKLGKSWLILALGAAVGSGGAVLGRYRVERHEAAYLALEDTPRRLKDRLEKIGAASASGLNVFTEWRSGAEGIADLDAYLEEYSDIKLVLIDTLARFRGAPQGDDRYAADYAAAACIKTLADKHDCAIVVVHHVRKMPAEDVMDTVSGSNGLNGAADSTWILTRVRGEADASLFITGRDVEEQTLALRFDGTCGSWAVLGDAAEYAQSRERREVLDAVPLEPMTRKTKDIVAHLGKKPAAVSRLLEKLEAEGLVFSPKYGEWSRKGGKSGKSVNVEPLVMRPEQGTFTLIPDLPGDTPTAERIVGLAPAGIQRLEEIKKANEARMKAEIAGWSNEDAMAVMGQVKAALNNSIALTQLVAETAALSPPEPRLCPVCRQALPPAGGECLGCGLPVSEMRDASTIETWRAWREAHAREACL
jgi:DNA-binding transcriptional ArsR family regulator